MSLKKRAGILKKNGEITFDRILKISEFVSKAAHKSFSMYFVWAEKSRQNFTINKNQANFALVGLAKAYRKVYRKNYFRFNKNPRFPWRGPRGCRIGSEISSFFSTFALWWRIKSKSGRAEGMCVFFAAKESK